MALTDSTRVRAANKASPDTIASVAGLTEKVVLDGNEYTARLAWGSDLDEELRDAIWALWEANMRALIEASSFGWDPHEKKTELFDGLARYILLLPVGRETNTGRLEIAALANFRFEHEEGEDLLYCYELQVANAFRRRGLGRFLMEKLSVIGKHWHMDKVMLTVLQKNEPARTMYTGLGFELDPCSPDDDDWKTDEIHGSEEDRPRVDYYILSKSL